MMENYSFDKGSSIPSEVVFQFNQIQPEIIALLAQSPKFGIVTLEVHFMDKEIKRIVCRREESVLIMKGEAR